MKLIDFVEKDNKCICTRFARLKCAEHAEPPVREEPEVAPEVNSSRIQTPKLKLTDFVEKDNKCICTRFARLTCAEHAERPVREEPEVSLEVNSSRSYISPPDRDEPEHKRLFKIELKNFIKTHNKCLCVLYDRLKCGTHGKYLPIPADPQHISFPGPIRILFDFFHLNQVFLIFATK